MLFRSIQEFAVNPKSRRLAFLACLTTFHAIDYLAPPGSKPNKGNLLKRFRSESAEFAVMERVACAFKHVKTGKPDTPANQPLASGDLIARPPGTWGEAVWGLSNWGDLVGGVSLDQHRTVDLLATVRAAARFIRAQSTH